MGVLGLSGSGKTSLARGLVGIWPVLQGEVRLDGSELAHYDPIQLGRRIGSARCGHKSQERRDRQQPGHFLCHLRRGNAAAAECRARA